MYFSWIAAALLAVEANNVITLRMAALMRGGEAATAEAVLMVDEKVRASLEANAAIISGASMNAVIARYRELVEANSKRLSVK